MSEENLSDSSDDFNGPVRAYGRPQAAPFDPSPHVVTVVKSETGIYMFNTSYVTLIQSFRLILVCLEERCCDLGNMGALSKKLN